MVDLTGITGVSGGQAATRVQPTQPTQPAQPVRPTTPQTDTPTTQLSGLAQQLASSAPIDVERVAQIKRAIANGTFPILPSTIADRLLALRQGWSPNEQA